MTTRKPSSTAAAPSADAAAIAAARRALEMDRAVPGGVHVEVHDGEATITGTVHSLFQKAEAEDVVRHVNGVRHVTNKIAVKPDHIEPVDESC